MVAKSRQSARRPDSARLPAVVSRYSRRWRLATTDHDPLISPEAGLRRGMYYPVRWDRFFKDFMTLADIYRYPTQRFRFHQQQLTLGGAS